MKYTDLKMKQQDEFNKFPLMAAFNDKQFEEGMKQLGVKKVSELYSIGGGCYIRKKDSNKLQDLLNKQQKELKEFLKDDDNLKDMFVYEMQNHEYQLTGDDEEVIRGCNLAYKTVMEDERMLDIYNQARAEFHKLCEENGWW